MQLDAILIGQVAVPVGCLFLGGWQFIRANRYRQRLTDAREILHYELTNREQYLTRLLLSETGTQSVDEFIAKWRQLNSRLGYALHHIEDFNAEPLLKQQLVTIASRLRIQSNKNATYQPIPCWPPGLHKGGFREVGGGSENEKEAEVEALVDGLNNWQLATICCYIMDGFYLEGAFARLGITVLSPNGKAIALGEAYLNPYGCRLHSVTTQTVSGNNQSAQVN